MLVITAELWPGGDKTRKRTIGEMLIANESELAPVSSYSVAIFQAADPGSGAAAWRSALVVDGHRRADGAWALVRAILDQTLSATGSDPSTPKEGQSHA